jgi:hypothetical protein
LTPWLPADDRCGTRRSTKNFPVILMAFSTVECAVELLSRCTFRVWQVTWPRGDVYLPAVLCFGHKQIRNDLP